MEWISLFLKMENKKVFILGSGEVGFRRAERFLNSKSKVIIAGNSLSKKLKEKGAILEEIDLKIDPTAETLMKLNNIINWSDLVVIASENPFLNEKVSLMAKDKLLNRADFPKKGNVIVPTKFNIDNIEISIYTNGKSPLMARELRKRLSKAITTEDILQIKLQEYIRDILKKENLN
ncbi:MAG: bifunctional precorrin-2 dehydrogenase/sirohydrochlorin ferrochelatase, partial [Methanobrevibacter sp.]|nr:bifunctional precorrin-2 dehydrogenase/sirohydrochlorin ferrochelatase [Methanobrevibacter sp.]